MRSTRCCSTSNASPVCAPSATSAIHPTSPASRSASSCRAVASRSLRRVRVSHTTSRGLAPPAPPSASTSATYRASASTSVRSSPTRPRRSPPRVRCQPHACSRPVVGLSCATIRTSAWLAPCHPDVPGGAACPGIRCALPPASAAARACRTPAFPPRAFAASFAPASACTVPIPCAASAAASRSPSPGTRQGRSRRRASASQPSPPSFFLSGISHSHRRQCAPTCQCSASRQSLRLAQTRGTTSSTSVSSAADSRSCPALPTGRTRVSSRATASSSPFPPQPSGRGSRPEPSTSSTTVPARPAFASHSPRWRRYQAISACMPVPPPSRSFRSTTVATFAPPASPHTTRSGVLRRSVTPRHSSGGTSGSIHRSPGLAAATLSGVSSGFLSVRPRVAHCTSSRP